MSATASSSSDKLITLVSSDDKEFMISRNAIRRSTLIESIIRKRNMDKSEVPGELISLPEVNSTTLRKVLEYCEHEVNAPIMLEKNTTGRSVFSLWVKSFVRVDQTTLYKIILAAKYLGIQCLLRACCQSIADMLKGKSTEQMRRILHIENNN